MRFRRCCLFLAFAAKFASAAAAAPYGDGDAGFRAADDYAFFADFRRAGRFQRAMLVDDVGYFWLSFSRSPASATLFNFGASFTGPHASFSAFHYSAFRTRR